MIDIEGNIFSDIATALRAEFSGINVTGEYVYAPASFPHVSIEETDNFMPKAYMDSSGKEKFASVTYKISVYSNKSVGKKTECKKILDFIDQMMISKNFRRISKTPVPNEADSSIYRLVATYEAVTDGGTTYYK